MRSLVARVYADPLNPRTLNPSVYFVIMSVHFWLIQSLILPV